MQRQVPSFKKSTLFSSLFRRARFALQLAVCLSLLLATSAAAGTAYISRKISGSSPDFMDISYFQFEFSPDGDYVVFITDRGTDEKYELYSVRVTGSTPTRISGPISLAGGDVKDFVITPDSHYVIYTANPVTATQTNLYCVPITGGEAKPEQLNQPAHANAGIGQNLVKISPDGHYVVYQGDQETDGESELFSVPIDASCQAVKAPAKLNDPILPELGNIDIWDISPNSQRVVYRADAKVYFRKELYSVPINRGVSDPVARLNDILVTGGYVSEFSIASNSQKVVYSAVQETAGVAELYAVPIAGGGFTKLNPDILAGHRGIYNFAITPNSAGVVYIADQVTPYVDELYSVAITGGTIKKLNSPISNADGNVVDFHITLNSQGVVYKVDQNFDEYFELYSNWFTGGTPYRLDSSLPALGDVYQFEITPNSLGVVFFVAGAGKWHL